jgi:hypothetical protein
MPDGESTVADQQATRGAGEPERFTRPMSPEHDGDPRGQGWVTFAGIMLMIAGTLNFIYGIAAIGNAHFYIANAHYVISELNTWGWVITVIGALQFCAGIGIWLRQAWARWTGVFFAGLNAIVQLIFIAGYPLLSLAIFALDLLVIYGLVTYGGKLQEA